MIEFAFAGHAKTAQHNGQSTRLLLSWIDCNSLCVRNRGTNNLAKYDVGQRWSYRTREQDVGSTLLIGHVQKGPLKPPVIHVMVDGIVSPHAADPIVIGHMPFSKKAINASVLELVETGAQVKAEFEDGISTWKSQKGGVFDLTVSEAVDAVVSMVPTPHDDSFDKIVTEMRSKQSEELIGELYRQLFSLDQWFFLCERDNDRAPVQWEFPDGMSPTPALLAFTSQQRAASAAVALGIYPEGSSISIVPASVEDSVNWISGPDYSNDWLCFNLTQQNFPLYRDDAVRLLENM